MEQEELWYVNPCLVGFCEKIEKLSSRREDNRRAAYMWLKATGIDFLLIWMSLLVYKLLLLKTILLSLEH